jgi:hypothetical protein
MSPEQAVGREVGPASDIFSLGAVLTFAATGEGPFSTGSTAALIYRVVHGQPRLDGLPPGVRPLVERCLAKDPADRPAAGELLAELTETPLTEDWLPDQIAADLPRYAVSGAGHPDRTVTSAGVPPGSPKPPGQPATGAVTRDRPRRGRRRVAVASAAVVLAASAVTAFALAGRPAAGHPRLPAGSTPAASPALAASHAAASPEASTPARRSPAAHASVPAKTVPAKTVPAKTVKASPAPPAGADSPPKAPAVPAAAVAASLSSAYAPLNGNVFVNYQDGTDSNAAVSGQVTNAVSGEVARLYAQRFPFTSPPALAASAALDPSGTTAPYSFQVTPTLATRYTVEVFRDSAATAPLAASSSGTVYVAQNKGNDSTRTCTGSQCQVTDTATVVVPASALSTQMAEHVYTYFGISYAATGNAPVPATLKLGAGNFAVGAPQQVSADEYQFTMTFSFSTNDESYAYSWHNCTVSMEAQDGVGLPGGGGYGCGSPAIPQTETYLG